MENGWTDKKELERITNVFETEFDTIKKTIYDIKDIDPDKKIGNVGLYAGNKIRSMYKRYKKAGVNYGESMVNKAVETYFVYQCDNAIYALKRFLVKVRDNIDYKQIEKSLKDYIRTSPDLQEYKDICDEVYEFDLDRDSVKAIEYALDNMPISFVFDVNEIIDSFNQELKQLGINQKIEHREIDERALEIAEEEMKFLKLIVDEMFKQLSISDGVEWTDEEPETDVHKTIIKKNKE